MTSEPPQSPAMAAPLASRVGQDATAAQIAAAVVAIWHEIDAALAPIVGQRGVAALYKRSLHLTGSAHPWIGGADGGVASIDLAKLESRLAQQPGAAAVAAGDAHFQTFHALLATLVGAPLTERLLRSVWANTTNGPAAQDTTP